MAAEATVVRAVLARLCPVMALSIGAALLHGALMAATFVAMARLR